MSVLSIVFKLLLKVRRSKFASINAPDHHLINEPVTKKYLIIFIDLADILYFSVVYALVALPMFVNLTIAVLGAVLLLIAALFFAGQVSVILTKNKRYKIVE